MSSFSQIGRLILVSIPGISSRLGLSSIVVFSTAGVTAVLVSLLGMGEGLERTLAQGGRPDRIVVVSTGAESELTSGFSQQAADVVMNAPGIAVSGQRSPVASAESVGTLSAPERKSGVLGNVVLRGVGPHVLELRPELRIIEGRMFRPGLRELVVGRAARDRFAGLTVGSNVALSDGDWPVVGVFSNNGDARESEILADAETVLASHKQKQFQSVTARLQSTDAFAGVSKAIKARPDLSLDVHRESDYYRQRSQSASSKVYLLSYVVGGIMALGAIFAGLNSTFTAVRARTREIATLRAIGFGGAPVIGSVMCEALLLAICGAAIGAALAWLVIDGRMASTGGGFTSGNVTFRLTVTTLDAAVAAIAAILIGVIAGLFPAIRAARVPVSQGLMST